VHLATRCILAPTAPIRMVVRHSSAFPVLPTSLVSKMRPGTLFAKTIAIAHIPILATTANWFTVVPHSSVSIVTMARARKMRPGMLRVHLATRCVLAPTAPILIVVPHSLASFVTMACALKIQPDTPRVLRVTPFISVPTAIIRMAAILSSTLTALRGSIVLNRQQGLLPAETLATARTRSLAPIVRTFMAVRHPWVLPALPIPFASNRRPAKPRAAVVISSILDPTAPITMAA
jgi:hypothetical protein